jgi:hypothetical protein
LIGRNLDGGKAGITTTTIIIECTGDARAQSINSDWLTRQTLLLSP